MLRASMNESHHYPTDWRHHLTHANYLLGLPAAGRGLSVVFGGGGMDGGGLLPDTGGTPEGHRAPGLVIWRDCRSLC